MAATIPETVTVPVELVVDALATISHFEERLLVLNGRQQTPETSEILRRMCELAERFFGLTSYFDDDGNTTHPIFQAIEDRADVLTAEWVADIAWNAGPSEAVA